MFMKCPYNNCIECEVDYHIPACMQGKGDKYCWVEFEAKYPEEYAEKEKLEKEERRRKEAEEQREEQRKATAIAIAFGIGIVLITLSLLVGFILYY